MDTNHMFEEKDMCSRKLAHLISMLEDMERFMDRNSENTAEKWQEKGA